MAVAFLSFLLDCLEEIQGFAHCDSIRDSQPPQIYTVTTSKTRSNPGGFPENDNQGP